MGPHRSTVSLPCRSASAAAADPGLRGERRGAGRAAGRCRAGRLRRASAGGPGAGRRGRLALTFPLVGRPATAWPPTGGLGAAGVVSGPACRGAAVVRVPVRPGAPSAGCPRRAPPSDCPPRPARSPATRRPPSRSGGRCRGTRRAAALPRRTEVSAWTCHGGLCLWHFPRPVAAPLRAAGAAAGGARASASSNGSRPRPRPCAGHGHRLGGRLVERALTRGELGQQRVAGAQLGDRRLDAGLAGQLPHVADLLVGHQRDHGAAGAGPGRAARAVQIRLVLVGGSAWMTSATSSTWMPRAAMSVATSVWALPSENAVRLRSRAFCARLPCSSTAGTPAATASGQGLGAALRPREHEGAARRGGQVDQHREPVLVAQVQHVVGHRRPAATATGSTLCVTGLVRYRRTRTSTPASRVAENSSRCASDGVASSSRRTPAGSPGRPCGRPRPGR